MNKPCGSTYIFEFIFISFYTGKIVYQPELDYFDERILLLTKINIVNYYSKSFLYNFLINTNLFNYWYYFVVILLS